MARKPDKRVMVRRRRAIAKVRNRKFNPPVRGKVVSLQEQNRPLLLKLKQMLAQD
ncbi:MAG: hypothetical protein RML72_10230 [Bacteroidia bacterium]|nr:hypothetical protein [Bacteroidia bacterium]MDW8159235.1 hypothetical protein [Bacteroidia bacterium]